MLRDSCLGKFSDCDLRAGINIFVYWLFGIICCFLYMDIYTHRDILDKVYDRIDYTVYNSLSLPGGCWGRGLLHQNQAPLYARHVVVILGSSLDHFGSMFLDYVGVISR